jgi:antitoxin component YwqK of YwqJK toxin-antitoxin module
MQKTKMNKPDMRLNMKRYLFFLMPFLGILASGCQNSKQGKNEEVISERYIHKYGYDVSKKEWETAGYPGQVITTLRNGVTITASYEDGILHGPTTYTYAHSQTLESLNIYERGNLMKKTSFSIQGIPFKEETFLSPSHLRVLRWYNTGTPMSLEEFHHTELLEGEYYNKNNEAEYRVIKGAGTRIIRDQHEQITSKETIENGYPILRETFYSHGVPHTIIPLSGGKVHGEKNVFAPSGEPISKETFTLNVLDGPATYFQNGCRYLESNYKNGLKHGTERHYIDGETIVEETEWYEGHKHGPSIVYFDGMSKIQWYYNNIQVSKERYRELCKQEENIAIMNDRAKRVEE